MSQGAMQQHQLQAINGDTMPGHGNIHISSPLESAAASNIPTTNSNRSVMVPSNYSKQEFWEMKSLHFKVLWLSFNCQVENFLIHFVFLIGFKRDPGESLPRAVLLVDPPLNDMPIVRIFLSNLIT